MDCSVSVYCDGTGNQTRCGALLRDAPQFRANTIMRTILVASAALVIGSTTAAMAAPFVMGNGSISSIGDEIGSRCDIFTITGNSGTASGY